uniref:Probable molybdopterin-synthase adenylyltransferase n=1 Tax=Caulacanthus okamurae TaxID=152008 RepID=A0A6H1U6Z7_9FLOR|nr:molybdopterin biosynthesis protein [Caulacanthus okamurae]QIZ74621.1 molybdopterin biosynthesis protein [Caulacanthus okamurae]
MIKTDNLSYEEYKIYARQIILENVGVYGQNKLKKTKILFIGAGGLGCPAITYLALSGVGCLGIVDHDTVSKSNLHRQTLHNLDNINELKVISAQQKIKIINPNIKVNIYPYKLTNKNARQLINKYDLILDSCDNFFTRYLIDELCYKLHKVHIYGAIQNFEGHISVFNYKGGPKYSDIYPKYLNLEENDCSSVGVIGIVPGIIGILQATEAVKIILGIGQIMSGYILKYNSLNISLKKMKIRPRKTNNQAANNTLLINNQQTITKDDLKKSIEKKTHWSIIDVRQKAEFNNSHILNACNIPLKDLKIRKNINLINKLANKTKIVIYCSKNSRSIIASQVLNRYNICHYRLQDGLHTWRC